MSVLNDAGARKKSEKPGTEIRKLMMSIELGVQGFLIPEPPRIFAPPSSVQTDLGRPELLAIGHFGG
jgi:hypothetical protein